jgi:hypothetical protein
MLRRRVQQFPRIEIEETVFQVNDVEWWALPEDWGVDAEVLYDFIGPMSRPFSREAPLRQ